MEPTKILFLKQTAMMRHWFMELGTDLAKTVGPSLMYTSVGKDDRIGNLRVLKSPPYRKDSDLHRLWSWFRYFLVAVGITWRAPSSALLFIVAQPPYLPLIGYVRNLLTGQKYTVWIDDVYPDVLVRYGRLGEGNALIRLWKGFNRLIYSRASCMFTLGPCMADVLSQYLPASHGRDSVAVIPTWVDCNTIRPIRKEENPFAVQYGQLDKLTVLYSGNLGLSHNLETMVGAAKRLRARPDIHFMVIGSGSRWEEMEKASKELPNLTLLPYQPESVLPFSLATGDVGVISLERDFEGISMPSKTYYVMSAGSALLGMSADPSDLQAVIDQHQCGVNIEPGDVAAFVEAVVRFADDKDYLGRCRQNARQAAEHVFSREVNVERVLKIVSPLIRNGE